MYQFPITNTAGNPVQIPFENLTLIDGKKIISCEILSSTDLAYSPTGNESITDGNLANLTVTLYNDNVKTFDNYPATGTNARINSGIRATLQNLDNFNSQKSFITQNTGTGFTVGDVINVVFNYVD